MGKYSSDLSSVYVGGGEKNKTSLNPADVVDLQKLPDGKYLCVRLLGGVMVTGSYWVTTLKRDKSKGQFNTGCCSWDPVNRRQDDSIEDAWRDFERELVEAGVPRQDRIVRFATGYYMNAIIRSIQDDEPSRKPKATEEEIESGFKDKDSNTWTPVRVLSLPVSVLDQIQKLKSINTARVKSKTGSVQTKAFDINHPKFGCDVMIMYDSSKAGAAKYSVQKGDRTPLTDEEKEYLPYDLDKLFIEIDPSDIQKDFEGWKRRNKTLIDNCFAKGDETSDSYNHEDEDDEDVKPRKRKAVEPEEFDDDEVKPAKKRSSKKSEPEEIDDFDEDEGFDDDEDEKPTSKKSKKPTKKSEPEDDFDDDDFGDDEEDEDEKPVKRSSKKSEAPWDEDDFDDEDEKPASKKSSKKPAKKSEPDDDFDDDFDDDDDDDFEDEKPAPKKAAVKKRSAKKPEPEPEDDFDDDFDDEDF